MSINLLERTAVGRVWDPRAAGAIALTLVFLCGAAVGAVIMDFGVHKRPRPPAFDGVAPNAISFDRMEKELSLTRVQSEQIHTILNDFWQYYRTVLSDGQTRVEQVLTEPQRRKFRRLLLQEHQTHP